MLFRRNICFQKLFREKHWAGGVAQVVEHLLSKREALSSNSAAKKKKNSLN
jgi:hypothetical protein